MALRRLLFQHAGLNRDAGGAQPGEAGAGGAAARGPCIAATTRATPASTRSREQAGVVVTGGRKARSVT